MSDTDAVEEALADMAAAEGIERKEALVRALVAVAESEGIDVPSMDDIAEMEDRLAALESLTEDPDSSGADNGDGDSKDLGGLREDVAELRESVETLSGRVERLSDDFEGLSGEVSTFRTDTEEKIGDLRTRLVRIYREAETKAPEDHDHPELATTLAELQTTVDSLTDAVEASDGAAPSGSDGSDSSGAASEPDTDVTELRESVAELADRVSSMESTVADSEADSDVNDDVSEKLSRLANAVVGVQRRLRVVERRTADAELLARLTATANTHGIRKAACEGCEGTVHLALLSKPRCPHCDREFSDLTPKSGFFGTARLAVGDPPALEGDVAAPTDPTAPPESERSAGSGTDATGSVPTDGPHPGRGGNR